MEQNLSLKMLPLKQKCFHEQLTLQSAAVRSARSQERSVLICLTLGRAL